MHFYLQLEYSRFARGVLITWLSDMQRIVGLSRFGYNVTETLDKMSRRTDDIVVAYPTIRWKSNMCENRLLGHKF